MPTSDAFLETQHSPSGEILRGEMKDNDPTLGLGRCGIARTSTVLSVHRRRPQGDSPPGAAAGRVHERSVVRPLLGGLLTLVGALMVVSAESRAQEPQESERPGIESDRRCQSCHGRPHIAELSPADRSSMVGTRLVPGEVAEPEPAPADPPPAAEETPPTRPGLYVTLDALAEGVHSDVHCIECHPDADLLPHAPRLERGLCGTSCHEVQATAYGEGSHRLALDEGDPQAPTCASCHGSHEIVKIAGVDSRVHRLKSIYLCADCHEQHGTATPEGYDSETHVSTYLASTHGKALSDSGLVAAATCTDCHAAHGVQPAHDPRSLIHRDRVPETCGSCHMGVIDVYAGSIHGQRLAEGNEDAPVCSDCHTAHSITHSDTHEFMLDIVNECGTCHDNVGEGDTPNGTHYRTYRASYHGQITRLGSTRAARCSDCHGAHDVLPTPDPNSRVHPDNLTATCGQVGCHPGANSNFVQFDPHADFRNAERYPILHAVWIYFLVVMSGAFGFFGLHTVLWFLRSLVARIKEGKPKKHESHGLEIQRFSILNRVNHGLVAITFLGLVATGVPLAFANETWAVALAWVVGGIEMAGVWHRVFGFMLILNLLAHFIGIAVAWKNRRGTTRKWLFGPNSLLPAWRDVTDCVAMFRWFFGLGPRPRFDRWTYFEKFDYWCEIGGSAIIGGSGLLLWFPMLSSEVLPGWAFNVAMIVHGYEALLALGFIFTIHFFNANLRIDKFPVDEVIFSGRLPEEELAEERPDEYERLVATGTLERLRRPPWEPWKRHMFTVLGICAMVFAITLLVLMIVAGLKETS